MGGCEPQVGWVGGLREGWRVGRGLGRGEREKKYECGWVRRERRGEEGEKRVRWVNEEKKEWRKKLKVKKK